MAWGMLGNLLFGWARNAAEVAARDAIARGVENLLAGRQDGERSAEAEAVADLSQQPALQIDPPVRQPTAPADQPAAVGIAQRIAESIRAMMGRERRDDQQQRTDRMVETVREIVESRVLVPADPRVLDEMTRAPGGTVDILGPDSGYDPIRRLFTPPVRQEPPWIPAPPPIQRSDVEPPPVQSPPAAPAGGPSPPPSGGGAGSGGGGGWWNWAMGGRPGDSGPPGSQLTTVIRDLVGPTGLDGLTGALAGAGVAIVADRVADLASSPFRAAQGVADAASNPAQRQFWGGMRAEAGEALGNAVFRPWELLTQLTELPFKLEAWGSALLDSQRELGQFNAAIAGAFAELEVRGIQRQIASGQRTADSTVDLADAVGDLSDGLQPVKDLVTNATNRVATFAIRLVEPITSTLGAIAEKIDQLLPGGGGDEGLELPPLARMFRDGAQEHDWDWGDR